MKRCQKCSYENDDAMRFCLECGTPLADAPIVVNWQDSGTQKQSNIDTASFGQSQQTQVRGGWDYQQQQQRPNFGVPPTPTPNKPGSNKKLFVIIGGIFVVFLLFAGAGAAIIAYNILYPPRPTPTATPSPAPTKSPSVSPTRSPKPSPSVSPETKDDSKVDKTKTGVSTRFERMWVDYNVTENGRRGMRIHTTFRVLDMKNQDLYLAIYFQKKDGTKLFTNNRNFRSTTGQVALFKSLRPAYDETLYEDQILFMPYDELNLDPGFYELQMDADVIYENGTLVEHMNFYDFEYEKD